MSARVYTVEEIRTTAADRLDPDARFILAPAEDQPVTMRGEDEVGQWMLTIYPDVIELAVRPGDNDTWSAPMRFKREES